VVMEVSFSNGCGACCAGGMTLTASMQAPLNLTRRALLTPPTKRCLCIRTRSFRTLRDRFGEAVITNDQLQPISTLGEVGRGGQ
jgi:hypothetical protein